MVDHLKHGQEHLKRTEKTNQIGVWMPHELSHNNRDERKNTCISLLLRQRIHPFLHRVATGDEKWIVYDNINRKWLWFLHNQKPVPTPKPGLTIRETLLSVCKIF
jgi:[histone H3]-lysine36 N-dimethyltransferase SETMAR